MTEFQAEATHDENVVIPASATEKIHYEGELVVVLEAMKMEHEITADVDGAIEAIVAAGSQVAGGDVLARIGPDGAEAPD